LRNATHLKKQELGRGASGGLSSSCLISDTRDVTHVQNMVISYGANKEVTEPRAGSSTVEVITSKVSQSLLCLVNSYNMSVSHGTMYMFVCRQLGIVCFLF
jgi:hypothetical protein